MPEKEMHLFDHLEELRRRILISAAAIIVITAVALIFSNNLLNVLLIPSGGLRLKAFGLMDGFMIKFRIALYIGIAAAFPVWGFELYRFVVPGLKDRERKALLPGLMMSSCLFVLGVVFGYYLLGEMIHVMISLFPPNVDFLPAAGDYISFVTFFLVACGVAFQLPVVITILVQLRILSATILRKQRKIAYFALFVFAEVVTPVSDPIVAPMVVMIPMVLLYEGSIWIALRIEAGRLKAAKSHPEIIG
ncbi:MAG: twin-arginine translocase subunit TatC [Anaerolineales bacterium]|jgi:sec-independent protein translocase protein TatC